MCLPPQFELDRNVLIPAGLSSGAAYGHAFYIMLDSISALEVSTLIFNPMRSL
jgi:hypothetical protein